MINISVVIPAYNERNRIEKTLRTIINYFKNNNYNYEIIVVDDGSNDLTPMIVGQFANSKVRLITNSTNRGKGYSVKRGVLDSQKEWILFSDADLSTPIQELEKLLNYKDKDVIIGSRALNNSQIVVRQPFYREYAGRLFNLLVRFLVVDDFKDTQCGFKLFKKEAARIIFKLQTIERFSFDAEILYIARKCGFKIKEVPVSWSNSKESKVSFIRDALQMLLDVAKIRLNDMKGLYNIKRQP